MFWKPYIDIHYDFSRQYHLYPSFIFCAYIFT